MARHVALLRGINVGNNMLRMERLRALCEVLGFENVLTYVQSGNIVFDANGTPVRCARALEEKLAGEVRLPVTVIVRSAAELHSVMSGNPFLKERGIDRAKLHVTFLASTAAKDSTTLLAAIDAGHDRFHVSGKEVFLHCPEGYGRTKLSNNVIEKKLGLRATTRNWNTVCKLCEMAGEDSG